MSFQTCMFGRMFSFALFKQWHLVLSRIVRNERFLGQKLYQNAQDCLHRHKSIPASSSPPSGVFDMQAGEIKTGLFTLCFHCVSYAESFSESTEI